MAQGTAEVITCMYPGVAPERTERVTRPEGRSARSVSPVTTGARPRRSPEPQMTGETLTLAVGRERGPCRGVGGRRVEPLELWTRFRWVSVGREGEDLWYL